MNPASERAFQLLDCLPVLIWTSGRDARCNFFNRAWLEFTGRELDEELGDGWTRGVHRGDLNDRLKAYLTAFRAREPFESEYRLRRHDGSYQWISEESRPIFDPKGEFAGFLGFARDVTSKKFSDQDLADSQRDLDIMARLSPVAIFQTDAECNCQFVNDRWIALTGISQQEALGHGWLAAFHEEDRTMLEERLRSSFETLEDISADCRLCKEDGAEAFVHIQGRPDIDDEGAVRGCIGSVTDLTTRRHRSEESLKISKVESLETLAGKISHEFNNLLTPILLNLNIARNQLHQPGYLHELSQRLQEAETAAIRAQSLTHRLLAFGKGGPPLKKVVDLKVLVEEASRFPLGGADDCVEIDFPEGVLPVNVDPGQFSQVIVALVTNAAEAISADGHIRIRATRLENIRNVSGLPNLNRPHIRLDIIDDGCGITPGMMAKIFDPYFSTKPGQSGLGLTTALSIVRKHQGHLLLSSQPGIGTTCTIYLPVSEEKIAPPPAPAPALAADGSKQPRGRILVMDDEELIRSSVRAILCGLGYEVDTARDGEEALEIYSEARESDDPIAVTLMDLTIQGGMDGKETVAELTALDPEAKAVVCSGHSNDPIMVNFRDYGFKGAIRKPFHPDELNSLLQTIINAN